MNEDLYNKIERYNNDDMDADEAASFRQQMYNDEDLADEVWVNQRVEEEFSDAKKRALREKLGELSESYVPVVPKRVSFRHWMPVILSTAAAAVALYFFVSRASIDSLISGTEFLENTPASYDGDKAIEENQTSLGVRLAQEPINPTLEAIRGKSTPEITINIQQPKESFVLAPTEADKAYAIKGEISQTDLERFGKPIIKRYDAKGLLGQEPVILVETESPNESGQPFFYNFELPANQGYYYYQIVSQDGQTVLYTGKLGIKR